MVEGCLKTFFESGQKTMHRCVKFSRATDKPCFSAGHIYQHKKVDGGSIKRDNEDFKKIKE